jgi:cytochrome P450
MSILPWAYYLTKYLPFEPFAGYYKGKMYAQAFNGKILAHIRMLRASGDLNPSSVGARLLQLQDEHGVSDREVMSEIHIIFIAGHETTAHTLSYFCYSIAMNPIVQQRCQTAIDKWMAAPESTLKRSEGSSEEANQPIGTSTGTSPELIPEYVEAVLKESMRRYPVAGQGSVRQVKKPDGCTLHYAGEDGTKTVYKIPKGTWTITSFYALHNAIENWGQSALEFIPERFLPNYGHDGQPVKKQAWVYAERKEREETSNAANVLEESVRSKSGVPCARSTTPLANKHSEPTGHASGRNDDAEMVIQDFPLDERNEERNGSSDGEGDVGRHGGDEEAEHVEGEYILRRPTTDMLGKGFPARIDMKADTSQANIFMPTSLPKKTSSNVNPLSTPSIYMGGGSVPEELTFSPFSHGPRRCLGYTLALLELRVAIAELVKRFNFEVADETMRDESVAFENATTLRPRGKWLLKVTAR